MAAVLVGDPNP